jgi:toxin ParE1/3/4
MTRIELAPEVLDDFERFMAHLAEHDVQDAPRRIGDVLQAIDILATSPLIGRPVKGGKRELVIGAGSGGYVALCSFVPDIDTVLVLPFATSVRRACRPSTTGKACKASQPAIWQEEPDELHQRRG